MIITGTGTGTGTWAGGSIIGVSLLVAIGPYTRTIGTADIRTTIITTQRTTHHIAAYNHTFLRFLLERIIQATVAGP